MRRVRSAAVAGVLALTLVLTGCSRSADSGTGSESGDTVTVFAAASLRATFTEIGRLFEAEHPDTEVVFNFAGSSDLFTQIDQGAPAGVFASADTANMTRAVRAGLTASDPVNFATNTLTIVVPPGNPAGVTSFADLARPDVDVVVCAPQVPCGNATQRIEDLTRVRLSPVSEESSVTDVLGKIVTGQADAGLVYVTDAAGAGDKVETIAFPESARIVNTYPVAVLRGADDPHVAGEFAAFVIGPEGRQVLSAAGFGAP